MVKRRNPYEPLSIEEIAKKTKENKELQNRIKSVAKLASECLDDPKFKKYKEEFEILRHDILNKIKEPIDSDPMKDAYYLRACINSIILLDLMLEKPKADVKKGGS